MSSLGFDLTTPDETIVGSASSLEAAASLAAGVYSRTGASILVQDTTLGAQVAWVGNRPQPSVPETLFGLSSVNDATDPLLVHFTLSGAEADTDVDFGDGQSTTVVLGTSDFDCTYEGEGTYHVQAISGEKTAETYVTVGEPVASPLRLLALEPDTAELGSEDITLHARGSGFQVGATISFSGNDEPTVYVTSEDVTTIVKPSLGWGAVSLPVYVRNPDGGLTAELDFTFTEAAPEVRA